MKKLLIFLLLLPSLLFSQQNINMPIGNNTANYNTCNAIFYDSGGSTGNHGINQNSSIKFTPSTSGMAIKIVFTSFTVSIGSTMTIYDGPDNTYTQIAIFNDAISPTGLPLVASPSPLNPDGSIYIEFISGGNNEMGWKATITCNAPCQKFNVQLDPLITTKPLVDDIYINVCKDSCVTFGSEGVFYQNNINYNQTQANTNFIWRFGFTDPDTAVSITQCFDEVRGWDYVLYAIDTMGCYSNLFKGRVRVSGNPISGGYPSLEACSNNNFFVNAGYDPMSTIQLHSIGSAITGTLSQADTVFLPDGSNICYNSDILFDIFDPGQTLNNISNLLGVKLTMEHSYLGDLSIRLICPSGQVVLLKQQFAGVPAMTGNPGLACSMEGGPTNLGCAPDPAMATPCYLTSGIGWDYEFRPGATTCFGNGSPTVGYNWTDQCGDLWTGPSVIPSYPNPYSTSPNQYFFGSFQDLSDLLGCPLNGNWRIMVCDHWAADNGYIFSWSLSLDQSIIPGGWDYNVGIDSVIWSGNGIVNYIDSVSANIITNTAGNNVFNVTVIDDYGCSYDTTFNVLVIQSPTPNINNGLDTVRICAGNIITLNSNYENSESTYWWNTGNNTSEIITLVEGLYSVTISNQTENSSLICAGIDSIYVSIYDHPVPDFEVDTNSGCAPLILNFNNLTTPDIELIYTWKVIKNNEVIYTSNQKNPKFFIKNPGEYDVYLHVITQNGCEDSLIKFEYIKIYPQPSAEFSFLPEFLLISNEGGYVYFTNYCDSSVFYNDVNVNWSWNFGDGNMNNIDWNPCHKYESFGDYIVNFNIYTIYGCKSSINHIVIVEEDLEFPNIITPNNDGFNDYFAIKNLNIDINSEDPEQYRTNSLQIYDRWGKKVYDVENYDTYAKDDIIYVGEKAFNGSGLKSGQYYFSFYYKGKIKAYNYSGSLIISK